MYILIYLNLPLQIKSRRVLLTQLINLSTEAKNLNDAYIFYGTFNDHASVKANRTYININSI